jgi:hypothetical protein
LEDYVGVNDFASLKNHMTDSGAGVVIDLGATQITLLNVLMKDLSASDFLFY